ncbi:MAG: hypothetical protein J5634_03670 [Bacilli bacterium]|nr:hypothetical protein [Bacilli bacterium]
MDNKEKNIEKIKINEKDKKIIKDYCFKNYHKENLRNKKIVLTYISQAIKRELDDKSIDFIIKEFISKNASISDFDDNTLNNVLATIFSYIDTHFQIIPALRLNSIRLEYKPQIDFSGVRYEDDTIVYSEKGNSTQEPHGWVRGSLPVDTKKERF